jgi:hypothetical protein
MAVSVLQVLTVQLDTDVGSLSFWLGDGDGDGGKCQRHGPGFPPGSVRMFDDGDRAGRNITIAGGAVQPRQEPAPALVPMPVPLYWAASAYNAGVALEILEVADD